MKKETNVLLVVAAAIAAIGLMVYGAMVLTEREEAKMAFQTNMAIAAENTDPGSITGDKAIAAVYDGNLVTYSLDYVPEEYRTEDHTQIRYVIKREEGSEVVGYYTHGGSGLKHKYTIEVLDLKLGTSQEKVFYGGEPPRTVTVKQGEHRSHYGSRPNEDRISEWVLAVLKGDVPDMDRQEHTEEPEMEEEKPTLDAEAMAKQEKNDRALQIATELLARDWGYSPSSLQEWLVEYEDCTEEEAAYAVENCGADWTEQALLKAKDCLTMESYGWGPAELEKLLLEEYGFTAEAVSYAMANCDPYWREQALKCAKYYADGFGFSYSNMYETMKMNHGFSDADAKYGVDNCNADWNQAAADHVAIFLEYSDEPYTRESMIREMVEWYGFTEEQAIYGVDQNGMK